MTECVHGMFACVCNRRRGESTPTPLGKPLIARQRRVYDCIDTEKPANRRTSHHYTTTILHTHYTHNNTECVQSVGTIVGGYRV